MKKTTNKGIIKNTAIIIPTNNKIIHIGINNPGNATNKTTAAIGNHKGDKTHIHAQSIAPIIFNTIKTVVNNVKNPILFSLLFITLPFID
jgi:hypothetical protein